jgi:hypothetical protein
MREEKKNKISMVTHFDIIFAKFMEISVGRIEWNEVYILMII